GRLTVAVAPSTGLSRFATRATHDAHVMPSIARSTSANGRPSAGPEAVGVGVGWAVIGVTPRRVLGWRSPAAARGGGRRGGGVRRCGRTRRGGPGSRWRRSAGGPRGGAPGCPTAEVTRVREAGSGVGHPGGGRGARPAGTGVAGSCRVRGVTGDRVRRGAGPGGRT